MMNMKLEGRNSQRGQALILVLIALALGGLLIVPTLNYVNTGLFETRVSEDELLRQYAADAAVEYSLWQLKYNVDNLTGQLDPDNPSTNTTITVNGIEVPIITEITQSPLGDDWPFPVPVSESGIHLTTVLVIEAPFFSADGQTAYFTHKIYMYNSGSSAVHMKGVFQQLDPSFTYVEGSYAGFEADLTEAYVDDHWELNFDFTEPLPKLDAEDATFVSFVASTTEEVGENTFSGSGWVSYSAFAAEEGEELFNGEYGPAYVGCYYDVIVTIGSYTVVVNVGITEEGELIIFSWQIL
ncbi:MAG: hypothetical protein ACETVS_01520 [Dehalococcoidales bacterium]